MTATEQIAPTAGIIYLQSPSMDRRHDEDGRPLGENKVPLELRRDVPMRLAQCPYPGSRYKHPQPMNVSALRQMMKHWPETLRGLGFLRKLFAPDTPPSEINLLDFWRIAKAGSLLPAYLILRAEAPCGDGQVPAFVAAIYKASLGLFNTAQNMALASVLTGQHKRTTVADPDTILAFADKEGGLIGKREVCAGPPHLIEEAITAITQGIPGHSRLTELLPRPEKFYRFALETEKLYLMNYIFPARSYLAIRGIFEMARTGRAHNGDFCERLYSAINELESGYLESSRSLAAADRRICEYYLSSLYELLEAIEENHPVNTLVRAAAAVPDDEKQRLADDIYRFLAAERPDLMNALAAGDLKTWVAELASSLLIERIRLTAHTLLQSRVNSALGRGATLRPLDGADLTQAFGKSLRDIFSEAFGVEVLNDSERTLLRAT